MENDDISGDKEKIKKDERGRYLAHFFKTQYEETQNPLYVWRAIEFLKDDGREYPNWIKKYLTETASNLLDIKEPNKNAPSLIKKALGIDDARAFSKLHYSWQKDYAYDLVIEERERRDKGKSKIYADICKKFNVSEETIRKWCDEVEKWREKIIEDVEKFSVDDLLSE
jgi:hypothetical protein